MADGAHAPEPHDETDERRSPQAQPRGKGLDVLQMVFWLALSVAGASKLPRAPIQGKASGPRPALPVLQRR